MDSDAAPRPPLNGGAAIATAFAATDSSSDVERAAMLMGNAVVESRVDGGDWTPARASLRGVAAPGTVMVPWTRGVVSDSARTLNGRPV
jgi:hypothetical protein